MSQGGLADLRAVVPAGGAGTRLWPLSRAAVPKFLFDLTGTGRSLLQQTWDRLTPLVGPAGVLVVTGQVHATAVAQQLPDLP
ncbi:MAG: mannose-1-phosphate guanylyltransferase, partial [Bifidobacteriaceae bacterium]|nr:mannose-1-phosphate guanylyltransferase [Bifidobacteriaceae bacterium]